MFAFFHGKLVTVREIILWTLAARHTSVRVALLTGRNSNRIGCRTQDPQQRFKTGYLYLPIAIKDSLYGKKGLPFFK